MDTSADALQPTSIIKGLTILLPELLPELCRSSTRLRGNSGGQLQRTQCQLSSARATAAKHLSVLFLKTSGGQRQRAAGEKQRLCHYHSCFCSEYLLTAFQLHQEKMTEIHTHGVVKMHF